MSEQQAPPNGDSPAVAGPTEAPGTAQDQPQQYSRGQEDVDWHKRYVDTQADYTRQQQEFAQKQQWYDLLVTSDDPDTRRQAAEVLGYELPQEEEPEPAYEDPYDELRSEVSSLRERYEQDQSAQQEAQQGQLIEQFAFGRLAELDPDLPEGVQQMIVAHAIHALDPVRLPPGSPVAVIPDIDAAYQAWNQQVDGLQKNWAKTKPRGSTALPGGVSATEAPLPLNATAEQRAAYAMQKWAEAQEPQ